MELDAHFDHMAERHDRIVESLNRRNRAADRRSLRNLYGIFLPELYRSEGQAIRQIGGAILDILRITPHIPELYRLHKFHKAESKQDGR